MNDPYEKKDVAAAYPEVYKPKINNNYFVFVFLRDKILKLFIQRFVHVAYSTCSKIRPTGGKVAACGGGVGGEMSSFSQIFFSTSLGFYGEAIHCNMLSSSRMSWSQARRHGGQFGAVSPKSLLVLPKQQLCPPQARIVPQRN